ncbi:MAG: hypothetical protein AzoDbin1_02578 [Azoarcus sp.]|nr:hypothetical protein [Azoarcus sp.]
MRHCANRTESQPLSQPYTRRTIWFSTPQASAKSSSVIRFIGWGAASPMRQSKDFG